MKRRTRRKRVKRSLIVVLLCVLSIIAGFYIQRKKNFVNEYVDVVYKTVNTEVVNKASIVMVGDALMHMPIVNSYKSNGSYNFKGIFKYIKPIVSEYDLAYYNQETILGGTSLGLSGYPQFNSPQQVGDAFIDAGFNLVSLATNHSMDNYYRTGGKSISNSVKYWKEKSDTVIAAGSYTSQADRDEVIVKEVNGIKYGFLSYTEQTNGISVPSGKSYLVNVYSKDKVKKDVEALKEKADVIIVAMHWGSEYTHIPTTFEKEAAKYLASLGVNLIIGSHPHVIQPMTYIGDTLVVYSLGNFVSSQIGDDRLSGLMASANIVKRTYHGKTTVKLEEPTAEFIYTRKSEKFIVYPYSKLNSSIFPSYKNYYNYYKKLMTDASSKVKVKGL
jgi:poly-gamma-glutamate synthesis protein (capsule biosynthesis protein)